MSAGWKHGDSVDEQAKTHPLLKPYKALSEKVHGYWCIQVFGGSYKTEPIEKINRAVFLGRQGFERAQLLPEFSLLASISLRPLL